MRYRKSLLALLLMLALLLTACGNAAAPAESAAEEIEQQENAYERLPDEPYDLSFGDVQVNSVYRADNSLLREEGSVQIPYFQYILFVHILYLFSR